MTVKKMNVGNMYLFKPHAFSSNKILLMWKNLWLIWTFRSIVNIFYPVVFEAEKCAILMRIFLSHPFHMFICMRKVNDSRSQKSDRDDPNNCTLLPARRHLVITHPTILRQQINILYLLSICRKLNCTCIWIIENFLPE